MRETVSGFKSPLYGLPNTTIELSALSVRDMPAFFPGWTQSDQFTVWALFGGIPGVLALFDREDSFEANLSRLLTRGSVFDFAVRLATEIPFRDPGSTTPSCRLSLMTATPRGGLPRGSVKPRRNAVIPSQDSSGQASSRRYSPAESQRTAERPLPAFKPRAEDLVPVPLHGFRKRCQRA